MALYYQIAQKNLPEFFVCHVPTTGLVDKKSSQYDHDCQMENQLSGPLPCSPENSIAVGHPV
jgi:hypothetical protein